nr:S-layer homology domain-containing protein [Cohnella zeiphila]
MDTASKWALDSIRFLNERGITQGYVNQSYQPHKLVTRQEVAALLARALKLPAIPSGLAGPSDMSPASWSYASVQAVRNLGLMGDPSEPFRPLEPVTREELVSIFAQATGAQGSGQTTLPEMDAGEVDPANRQKVEASVELGLLQGDGSTLDLSKPTERQEVAVILTRLMQALGGPADKEAVLTVVGTDKVRLGAFEYPMTDELKSLLGSANAELLNGATIKVKLGDDYRIEQIVDMTIPASKHDLELDGGQLRIAGNLKILGDNLTLKNLHVDGSVVVQGDAKSSLAFENVGIGTLELGTAARLTLSGDSKVASLRIPDEAVEGTQVVLQDEGAIDDIVVPDKLLVPALVKDYGVNRGKVRLINGQPPEQPATGGSSSSQPVMLYAVPIGTVQPVGGSYKLPDQVSVRMSNGTSVDKSVVWTPPEGVEIRNGEVRLSAPAVYSFSGAVEGLSAAAELKIDVRFPLKLSLSPAYQTVSAVAGQTATFAFSAAPDTDLTASVSDVAYQLQWFDGSGVNRTSEVQLSDVGSMHASRTGSYWILSYTGSHAVAAPETLSVGVAFDEAGTYTAQVTAIQYNPQ